MPNLPRAGCGFQLGKEQFRISSSKVHCINSWQIVTNWTEGDQIGSAPPENVQIILVIETKGIIAGNANPCPGGNPTTLLPGGKKRGCPAGSGNECIEITMFSDNRSHLCQGI